MARSHATIFGSAWAPDSEFRTLPSDVQLLYVALLAQPDLNLCGVMPFIPQRWERFASDFDTDRVVRLAAALELHGYVVTDPDTMELWIRQFMFHDRVLAQPQVAMAAAQAFDAVLSSTLRRLIVESLPPDLRHQWPGCLKGIKREQARTLLEACDAASWKPSVTPNASPNARPPEALTEGSGTSSPNGCLTEGSGLGSGLGYGFQGSRVPSLDASGNPAQETRSRAAAQP